MKVKGYDQSLGPVGIENPLNLIKCIKYDKEGSDAKMRPTLKPAHDMKESDPPRQIGIIEKSIGPYFSPISDQISTKGFYSRKQKSATMTMFHDAYTVLKDYISKNHLGKLDMRHWSLDHFDTQCP